jgi:hypothetical protein
LLDAPRLKDRLRQVVTPLVVVGSEDIYWSIVQHEYDGIPASAFEPLVRVTVAGRRRRGWVHVPAPRPTPGKSVVPAATTRENTAIAA